MSSLRETIHFLAENGGVINLKGLFRVESTPGTAPNPFFGMRGIIVDSDAIVIDDTKALPEPKEQQNQ